MVVEDIEEALDVLFELTGKTEDDLLVDFVIANSDDTRRHGDEGIVAAKESEEFQSYLFEQCEEQCNDYV
mgnify:CR=1 FL=1